MSTNSDMADVIRQWSPQYLRSEVARLRSRNEKLVAALRFYSDSRRYEYDETCVFVNHIDRRKEPEVDEGVIEDDGKRAREALSASPPDSGPAENDGPDEEDGPWAEGWERRAGYRSSEGADMDVLPNYPHRFARYIDQRSCIHCGAPADDPIHNVEAERRDEPAQRQDAMLERREALEALERLYRESVGRAMYSGTPNSILSAKCHDYNELRRALSRTSDGVPEAVRRLPERWRSTAREFVRGAPAEELERCADELDRAFAQSEQEGQSDE